MALGSKKSVDQKAAVAHSPAQELKQPNAHTCPTCQGRGIRPELSEHELCPDCDGSGTIIGK